MNKFQDFSFETLPLLIRFHYKGENQSTDSIGKRLYTPYKCYILKKSTFDGMTGRYRSLPVIQVMCFVKTILNMTVHCQEVRFKF